MNPGSLLLACLLCSPLFGAPPITPLITPADADSGEPNLATDQSGAVHLTWCAPGAREDERCLHVATLDADGSAWTAPRCIVGSRVLMENWADFPSMIVGSDGTWTAQWFERSSADGRSYRGKVARSRDAGHTWSAPADLGHEFVSLAPLPQGRVLAVWLASLGDGSHGAHVLGAPMMELRSCLLSPTGDTLGEWQIDPDVCTCCQTTLVALGDGRAGVAYRGHSAGEIRDIGWALFNGETWRREGLLNDDGWTIAGCPVNGPASDTRNGVLTVAWFTAAQGEARVQAKVSSDGGKSFGSAISIDLGFPLGRVEVVSLADGSAAVLWMENDPESGGVNILVRRVYPDGTVSSPLVVAGSSESRRSGFPRAAWRSGSRFVVAWTEVHAGNTHVATAEVDLADLVPGAAAPRLDRVAKLLPHEYCGEAGAH